MVAFEVDYLDDSKGWSVLVIGRTREETDPARFVSLDRAGLSAGAPGKRDRLVRIPISQISGRSFDGRMEFGV